MAAAGLDPYAEHRDRLYASAHSGNLAALAAPSLDILTVREEEHRFTFAGLDHAATWWPAPAEEFRGDLHQALRDR
ncbi:hypothetical protein AB0I77_00900 [Streptomyces sp. NPDC050619]|uniref:hypothetical protein n=1 Tax=Streptomyces sp. NPDC050619 TaxID=3157214 RepID=UPI00341666A4